jgi:hypothetical protein
MHTRSYWNRIRQQGASHQQTKTLENSWCELLRKVGCNPAHKHLAHLPLQSWQSLSSSPHDGATAAASAAAFAAAAAAAAAADNEPPPPLLLALAVPKSSILPMELRVQSSLLDSDSLPDPSLDLFGSITLCAGAAAAADGTPLLPLMLALSLLPPPPHLLRQVAALASSSAISSISKAGCGWPSIAHTLPPSNIASTVSSADSICRVVRDASNACHQARSSLTVTSEPKADSQVCAV